MKNATLWIINHKVKYIEMELPSLSQALAYLEEASQMNPGPWVQHSHVMAEAASTLAARLPGLDPKAARILGLLHDIGRRAGVSGMRHILDGYQFMQSEGYDDVARICLTHSFPLQDARGASAVWDCTPDQIVFITAYLEKVQYTGYDRLIQLCDALALPTGCCLIEKRLVDVALRYGSFELMIPKWQMIFQIKNDFEKVMGQSIYRILPGVVENTFDF